MSKEPYVPENFPPKNINWEQLAPLIGKANRAIAKYDGFLQTIPNPDLLLAPLLTNEAVYSSRIEGTQASLEDVFKREAGVISPEQSENYKNDILEVINYRSALIYASKELELNHREITPGLIKEIHVILLSGTRGSKRLLGEFRRTQNWIGRPGTPMEQARFIPPDPILIPVELEKLDHFIHLDYQDTLVQLAIFHAQFEITHPFEDGNGRVGRILIPLFLFWKGVLTRPNFYLSEYLERNRAEYYGRLLLITEEDDWQGWIEFFLRATIKQAEKNVKKAKGILNLYQESKEKFISATKSLYAIPLLDVFFSQPIIDSSTLMKMVNMSKKSTLDHVVKKLLNEKLIMTFTSASGRKPAIYAFTELLRIVRERKL